MRLANLKKKRKKFPDAPGVYFFLGPRKEILYIGKAASLRSRVRSYFSPDLAESRGAQIIRMVGKAKSIDFRTTDSVLEALILEANLIKAHKPRYNTDEKDDKSFNYLVITKEEYPRILLVRGKELEEKFPPKTRRALFGPFPHGLQLKAALKLVRKIFPYHDTCMAHTGMTAFGKKLRPCFNRQIGLCPGVCTGEVTPQEYHKTVRHIELLFQGKKKSLITLLEREMKAYAKKEEFEEAGQRRREIQALKHIQDVSLIKDEYRNGDAPRLRIEAYDVAHLAGGSMVGVMTVVESGESKRSDYRKFRIRSVSRSNDTAALGEILSRRLAHDEWPMPQLIVVDGAAAQVNTAEKILAKYGIGIPVVGVVKDEKHRPKNILGEGRHKKGREKEILLANEEAHRFAIGYHRQARGKKLLA